jgi:NADH dehydrogenase FAD-containing subunit
VEALAGVKCAKVLSRELSADDVEVMLFNRENHLVFSPLLAEAVGSSVNPLDAVVPLLQLLPQPSSVRARSAVKVLVMGKTVFTQASPSLEPFRGALACRLNDCATEPVNA